MIRTLIILVLAFGVFGCESRSEGVSRNIEKVIKMCDGGEATFIYRNSILGDTVEVSCTGLLEYNGESD